jgi:uncharacterized protein YdhG (YjbR/CyaY superfamily)
MMMDDEKKSPTTIDEYIAGYPEDVQKRLGAMRQTIRAAAPDAEEGISYGVPVFKLKGKTLVNFGAAKNHIGFYPTPGAIEAFNDQIAEVAALGGKGSVQFANDKPLPLNLVTEIVKFRVEQQNAKQKKK